MARYPQTVVALFCSAALFPCATSASEAPDPEDSGAALVVTRDLTLERNAVLRTPIVISADGITLDGNGATVVGPGRAGDLASFTTVGVRLEGRKSVTIRNLKARGHDCGLVAVECTSLTIEDCDFSDNYHDPDHGWGDGRRNGGMILTRVSGSSVRRTHANRVWNGLDLRECDGNVVEENDLSHSSNVCLKLWESRRNRIIANNLSWGLRMAPGEVHARDSTCVLIESGSDENRFERNDITHGGDGVFIRPLNGWVSTGNVFVENDCSYANNNGFESWAPGNTFIRNRANHCSFGFWLGGSDRSVLVGNEASWNGLPTGRHNAPEPDFSHGGIVIVNGQGHHSVIDGNRCVGNAGAGIVFRGDLGSRGEKWKMLDIIVQRNVLEQNRWGIFARFTDGLFLSANRFRDNADANEHLEEVTDLQRGTPDPRGGEAPRAGLHGPERVTVGENAVFDASGSVDPGGAPLTYHWRIGGARREGPRVEHTFEEIGFHRVWVLVTNGHLAASASLDVYAVSQSEDVSTERDTERWQWSGPGRFPGDTPPSGALEISEDALVGRRALRFRALRAARESGRWTLELPRREPLGWKLSQKSHVSFWLRLRSPVNFGLRGPSPALVLRSGKAAATYLPVRDGRPADLLASPPYAEARYGWLHVRVPLGESGDWVRLDSFDGAVPPHADGPLLFETVDSSVETESDSCLVSTGEALYLLARDGARLLRSEDGLGWSARTGPAAALGTEGGDWENAMLADWRRPDGRHFLVLRARRPERDEGGERRPRTVLYDVENDTWRWTRTYATGGHGAVVAGNQLFGIAHAVGGNFGGPLTRTDLLGEPAIDARSVLAGLKGHPGSRWWFSRAAKLALLGGRIYGIKNDWVTPAPRDGGECGDRIFSFDPEDYRPSSFSGGAIWEEGHWEAAETPAQDLGRLPFEPGHGSALVALPPRWCRGIGEEGGLFVVAGCSPSNHEGFGMPSSLYALFDIATRTLRTGRLPAPTGAGTSAAFDGARIVVKRGGVRYGPSNRQLWIVTPLEEEEASRSREESVSRRVQPERVERIAIEFGVVGPFDAWIDGLTLE